MRNVRTLLVAVPAFALGCFLTASLTTRAEAQTARPDTTGIAVPTTRASRAQAKPFAAQPRYHVATSESQINKYANEGYEVKHVTSEANYTYYLMER